MVATASSTRYRATRPHISRAPLCRQSDLRGSAAPLAVEQPDPELLASRIAEGCADIVIGGLADTAAQDIARRVAAQIGT